jgi:hypothetical protein
MPFPQSGSTYNPSGSNFLFVGMIAMSVKGTTAKIITAPTSQPGGAHMNQAPMPPIVVDRRPFQPTSATPHGVAYTHPKEVSVHVITRHEVEKNS